MTRARQGTLLLCALRVAYGVGLVVAPARLSRSWLGEDGARPGGRVALRGLGARDALIHVGAMAAILRDEPGRPWLTASVIGDASDVASTVVGASGLPDGAASATVLVAGGSALLTVLAAVALDR